MAVFKDQSAKDDALRGLLAYLGRNSSGPLEASTPAEETKQLARAAAYDNAAERLSAILDTPVAEPAPDPFYVNATHLQFQPEDVTVVVVAPEGVLGKGMPRSLFLGPNDDLESETLSPLTKLFVGALLDHAREQLSD
jgi:hypothetical protein